MEAHPLLIQKDLVDYSAKHGIHITAYMPFGGDASRGAVQVLGNPLVQEIAEKTGRTQGQVLVSWGIKVEEYFSILGQALFKWKPVANSASQRGFSVLPKSVKPSRIESNFDVFDLDNER